MTTLEKAIRLLQKMPENKLENSSENDLEKRRRSFMGLMSFSGTLPEDFNYKKELEEARKEKYARFICHADKNEVFSDS